MNPIESSMGVL